MRINTLITALLLVFACCILCESRYSQAYADEIPVNELIQKYLPMTSRQRSQFMSQNRAKLRVKGKGKIVDVETQGIALVSSRGNDCADVVIVPPIGKTARLASANKGDDVEVRGMLFNIDTRGIDASGMRCKDIWVQIRQE